MEWLTISGSVAAALVAAFIIFIVRTLSRHFQRQRMAKKVMLRLAYPTHDVETKLRAELMRRISRAVDSDPVEVANQLREELKARPEKSISQAIVEAEDISAAVQRAVEGTRATRQPAARWRRVVRSPWFIIGGIGMLVGVLFWLGFTLLPRESTAFPDPIWGLKVGQCFNAGPQWLSSPSPYVALKDCASPHGYQFYATADYPKATDTYPGATSLSSFASSFCNGSAFVAFTGEPYSTSALTNGFTYPDSSVWTDRNFRRVLCYVTPPNGEATLTGSAQYLASQTHKEGSKLIWGLEVGQCFNAGPQWPSSPNVTVKDCASPHRYQFYATADYPKATDTYPGATSLSSFASSFCNGSAFVAFTGEPYSTSALTNDSSIPDSGAWKDPNFRRVLCYVTPPNGEVTLTGSAQYSSTLSGEAGP
jgi:Septum formation